MTPSQKLIDAAAEAGGYYSACEDIAAAIRAME